MTLPAIHRILTTIVLYLAALGLNSCTITSTGFWLDEIGKLEQKEHPDSELRQVYQGPDYVYVQIPIVFIQNKEPIIRHLNIIEMWTNGVPYIYPNNKKPDISAPENYFLQIPLSSIKQGNVLSALSGREKSDSQIRLLSAKEVDLTTCVRLPDAKASYPYELLTSQRTWGNRLRRPLAWSCMVTDIPLSVIATPIGWIVDIVSYPYSD